MTGDRMELDFRGHDSCLPDDTFMVEVHGPVVRLLFAARLDGKDGRNSIFAVGNDIKYLPSKEPARLAVSGFSVLVKWGEEQMIGQIIDLSKEGICLMLLEEVMNGSLVHLEVKSKFETYTLSGVVRYCIEQNDGLGHCRVGVQLIHDDRLTTARWMSLFERIVDAA